MYSRNSENKGADQLRGYREADLRLCFAYANIRSSHGAAHLTIPTHTATGQLYVMVISTIHAITATGKLYAEAGYEYSSDRSSIRLKMYAPIKCP